MTAYTDFQNSIAAANSLIAMYKELRRARGLGQRGSLTAENEDLLWLPRSAIVTSLSALDAYVHAVLYERIPHVLQTNPMPNSLAEAMVNIVPIRNAQNFRDAMPVIAVTNLHQELANRLRDNSLTFLSYQAPEKINAGYDMIGHTGIFDSVSALWPGPNSTADDLKRSLAGYVKRRNQIAHEGDREASGAVRHIQPQYASKIAAFVENLVFRLNRVVYPNEIIAQPDAA
ncbi:HEPN domain-containing protein [Mesorhizobium sp. CAU 1732]|uniref:HEPN domain-containing protein n=1 Tax=Mesorhizobium sp. CAU 1732 TaxID=3140358 RepID=UPI0032609842